MQKYINNLAVQSLFTGSAFLVIFGLKLIQMIGYISFALSIFAAIIRLLLWIVREYGFLPLRCSLCR